MRATTSLTAVVLAAVTTACTATYDERKTYLDDSAAHGVAAHDALAAQGVTTDRQRCEDVYEALQLDVPGTSHRIDVNALETQGKRFFVDSCMSGTPSVGPVDTTPASTASTTLSSAR